MPLQIIRQDITKMQVDAIVNTTNEEMIGYSGVDLAVHTLSGKELDEECLRLAPLGLGQAKITGGYNLPCKYIIHTSGPTWRGGLCGESAILKSCYVESLKLALAHNCATVAFPLISSGVFVTILTSTPKRPFFKIVETIYSETNICITDRIILVKSQLLRYDINNFYKESDYGKDH